MAWTRQEMMRDGDTEEVVDMMSALSCSPALRFTCKELHCMQGTSLPKKMVAFSAIHRMHNREV